MPGSVVSPHTARVDGRLVVAATRTDSAPRPREKGKATAASCAQCQGRICATVLCLLHYLSSCRVPLARDVTEICGVCIVMYEIVRLS